jgi:hypothetical protein
MRKPKKNNHQGGAMDKLFDKLFGEGPFGLSWKEIEYLSSLTPGQAYFAPVYSEQEAVYLAAGASLKAGQLRAISPSKKDKFTAWPLWNVEHGCAFVLGFRFDSDWRPVAFIAEEVSFLFSVCSFAHLARTDRAWDWAGYAGLALDQGWLEGGLPILGGRFRTSYPEALLAASEALVIARTIQQKPIQENPSQEQQQQPSQPNEDPFRRRGAFRFFDR